MGYRPLNHYVPVRRGTAGDLAYIGWCYKSGSGSIRAATVRDRISPRAYIGDVFDDTREGRAEAVLFLRHPLARLRSSWRWWSGRRHFPQPIYGDSPSWERFIDLVLKDLPSTRDPHWVPQMEFHTYRGQVVPTTIHRFENIAEHWADWCSVPLEQRNVSGGGTEEFPNYRRSDLELYYAADLALWEQHG